MQLEQSIPVLLSSGWLGDLADQIVGISDKVLIDQEHMYQDIALVPDQWSRLDSWICVARLFANHNQVLFEAIVHLLAQVDEVIFC